MIIDIARRPGTFYSPLRYPGGKASLTDFVSEVITTNGIVDCTLVEPYAGGAGASISLLLLERVDAIVINDLDRAIYSFWNALVNESDRFIDRISKVKLNIPEWNRYRALYRSSSASPFDLGFATFYLNRTNRSGIIEGGVIGGTSQVGNWGLDARFNKEGLIKRVERIAAYRDRIKVTNSDGIGVVKRYSRSRRCTSNTLLFLDPPYYIKGGCLYLNSYTHEHHEQLAQCLNSERKLNWILTYDNTPEIRALYRARRSYPFELNYHADKAKIGNELLVFGDRLALPSRYQP